LEDFLGGVGAGDEGDDAAAATTGARPDVGAESASLKGGPVEARRPEGRGGCVVEELGLSRRRERVVGAAAAAHHQRTKPRVGRIDAVEGGTEPVNEFENPSSGIE
jgi:hypothetical protein